MFNGNIIESFFFSSLSFSLISLSHPLFLFLCCLSDPSLRLSLLLMILLLNISKILKTQFKQYKRSLYLPSTVAHLCLYKSILNLIYIPSYNIASSQRHRLELYLNGSQYKGTNSKKA